MRSFRVFVLDDGRLLLAFRFPFCLYLMGPLGLCYKTALAIVLTTLPDHKRVSVASSIVHWYLPTWPSKLADYVVVLLDRPVYEQLAGTLLARDSR